MKQPESAVAHYQRRRRRRLALLAALALALIASVALDVATGPSGMAVERLLQILRDPGSVPRVEAVIVWNVRLPYALMAVLVGAALALAGVEMQTVLDNPLASPFTLGVSAAAALGAALAIVLGLALPGVPPAYVVAANAFVFALASVALLYLLALWRCCSSWPARTPCSSSCSGRWAAWRVPRGTSSPSWPPCWRCACRWPGASRGP